MMAKIVKGTTFGGVVKYILDPAKQTRSKEEIDLALKKYLDMNRLALHITAPGGIFLMWESASSAMKTSYCSRRS